MQSFLGLIEDNSLEKEIIIHPHCSEERPGEYRAVQTQSTVELEVANYLNALTLLYKPVNVLETGTGLGFAALGIVTALLTNQHLSGPFIFTSIEIGKEIQDQAKLYLNTFLPYINLLNNDSVEILQHYSGPQFDFVLLDTVLDVRHKELRLLLERDLVTKGCIITLHDTSPHRHKTMPPNQDNRPMLKEVDKLCKEFNISERLEFPFSRGLLTLRC